MGIWNDFSVVFSNLFSFFKIVNRTGTSVEGLGKQSCERRIYGRDIKGRTHKKIL